MPRGSVWLLNLLACAVLASGCTRGCRSERSGRARLHRNDAGVSTLMVQLAAPPAATDAGGPAVVIAAAGDIGESGGSQAQTADLLEALVAARNLAAILPLGDNAYSAGLLTEYESRYAPAWGRPVLKALTHPVPGNHEYDQGSSDASGYFDYFNGVGVQTGLAGTRGQGYYSYDLGSWHLIALNSSHECVTVPCAVGSAQHNWLVQDLARSRARCTLAYWHHPRFQQGSAHNDTPGTAPLWDALYDAGADVVLNGHEHNYQQLKPMDKSGAVDLARGIRTFVVGSGGTPNFYTGFNSDHPAATETRMIETFGVLELTLKADSYDWRFITVDGSVPPGASGSGICH